MDVQGVSAEVEAMWETSSRFLASLINEDLVNVTVSCTDDGKYIKLRLEAHERHEDIAFVLQTRLKSSWNVCVISDLLPIWLGDLQAPAFVNVRACAFHDYVEIIDPVILFKVTLPWFGVGNACRAQIIAELRSSTIFQSKSTLERHDRSQDG